MSQASAGALFRTGQLQDAVAAAQAAVRRAPTDVAARLLLAELLLFTGNLERIDTILDAAADIDTTTGVVVSEFRQLLRAEVARRQLFSDGRVPEFLGEPNESQRLALAALVALRAGDAAEAGRLAEQSEAARTRVPGQMGDLGFDDMRDADDLLSGSFEVLTVTGKYFWVPTDRVSSLELHAPKRPRDLFWRRASMAVADGPEGDVYLPVIYATGADTDALKLGRASDWRSEPGGPVYGVGQRLFLVGEEAKTVMELTVLVFGA
jgi:type VI secretion system protein ImpE